MSEPFLDLNFLYVFVIQNILINRSRCLLTSKKKKLYIIKMLVIL